jgi:hypothetical protein
MRAAYRKSLRVYAYKKVPPKEFQNFLNAESKGTYINRYIKPIYDFEEVTETGKPKPQRTRQRNRNRA